MRSLINFIGVVLLSTSCSGETLDLPEKWSALRIFFEGIDEAYVYPLTDEMAAIARNALQSGCYSDDIMMNRKETTLDAGIRDTYFRWPGYPGIATVPYIIDDNLADQTPLIQRAMNQYMNLTCVNFVPRNSETDYIRLFKGRGCYSSIGRQGGSQDLSIGSGCEYIGTVVHELGHAIGLYHEHQRYDRDDYLIMYIGNVSRGQENNFLKNDESEEIILTDFDFDSIMIYGNYAFSTYPGVLETMEARTGTELKEPFQKPGLDNSDITEVRRLYECD